MPGRLPGCRVRPSGSQYPLGSPPHHTPSPRVIRVPSRVRGLRLRRPGPHMWCSDSDQAHPTRIRALPRLLRRWCGLSGGIPWAPWGWAWCALPAHPDSTTRTGARARYAGARLGSGRGACPSVTLPRVPTAPATKPAGDCGPRSGCGFLSGGGVTSPAGPGSWAGRLGRHVTPAGAGAGTSSARRRCKLIHIQLLRLPTLQYSSPRAGQPILFYENYKNKQYHLVGPSSQVM